ncbi:DsbA family oxidoreductase [Dyadobacter beijingensis]|nr:DsbA family protein [Dyadobacter beijingensis]
MTTPDLTRINVVYYTHPLCPVSFQMQDAWREFVSTFGDVINYKFCISAQNNAFGAAGEPSGTKAAQAVKAASLQSQVAADLYLDILRKAALTEGRDISEPQLLVDLARQISRNHRKVLDLHRFGSDFGSPSTRRALQSDEVKIRVNQIVCCPTITFTTEGRGIKATGLLTYHQLVQMLKKMIAPPSVYLSN